MQKNIIILLSILFVFSCDSLPDSTGGYNDITVVSSNEDREYVEIFISEVFKDSIYTPLLKSSHNVKYINPNDFIKNKLNKNMIILSLDFPKDSTIDLLSKKFLEKFDKQLLSLNDLYSKNQVLVYLNAHDIDQLIRQNAINSKWIKNEINQNISKNILYDYNKEDKSEEINSLVHEMFNINLNIDDSYKIIKKNSSMIWIGRGYPYRWIVINKVKKNNIEDFKNLKLLHESNLTSVIIPERYRSEEQYNSNIVLRGLYEHTDSDTGGPFVTYVYEDIYKDFKLYISGFVNNPGKDKILLLKQLESIFQNIKE